VDNLLFYKIKENQMKQQKLKNLLEEAAGSQCSQDRRAKIQSIILGYVSKRKYPYKITNPAESRLLKLLINELYLDTSMNRPDLLPTLFPAFVMLCSYSESESIVENVDWSIVD